MQGLQGVKYQGQESVEEVDLPDYSLCQLFGEIVEVDDVNK